MLTGITVDCAVFANRGTSNNANWGVAIDFRQGCECFLNFARQIRMEWG